MDNQKVVSHAELAKMFRVSRSVVGGWKADGLPFYGKGNHIRFFYDEVVEWLRCKTVALKEWQRLGESYRGEPAVESRLTNEKEVAALDKIFEKEGAWFIGDFGKVIGIGEKKFFSRLRKEGILHGDKGKSYNRPKQEYIDAGYFREGRTPRITKAGMDFIKQKLGGSL